MKNWLKKYNKAKRSALSFDGPVVVTIVGGLGSQILSAAAYFYLAKTRCQVFADTSYFNKPEKIAAAGEQCSQWGWELDQYDLKRSAFPSAPQGQTVKSSFLLDDGAEKLSLALLALKDPEIQDRFKLAAAQLESVLLQTLLRNNFACVHVRQGDYLNVASHVVRAEETLVVLHRLKKLVNTLVISSDSPLPENYLRTCNSLFENVHVLINHAMPETHAIMRHATVLVTSNSTFSLTAACLNKDGFILIPKIWFGGQHADLTDAILAKTTFAVAEWI